MTILIDLGNHLMSEALGEFVAEHGYHCVVMNGGPPVNGLTPEIVLADVTTIKRDILTQYPGAKILLLDSGLGPEKLCVTLLSYRIHGILSPNADLAVLKKALKALAQGQPWIDSGLVRAALDEAGDISQKGKISHLTDKEQQIMKYICQGLTNKTIAQKLAVSPHTVKAHLARIFRKFNVASRSKLVALFVKSGPASG